MTLGQFLPFNANSGLLVVAVVAALFLAVRLLPTQGYAGENAFGVAIWALPAGAVGAQLQILADHWTYFSVHPIDLITPSFGDGGALLGAIVLGSLAAVLACRRAKLPLGIAFDVGAAAVALGVTIDALGQVFLDLPLGDLPRLAAQSGLTILAAALLALVVLSFRRSVPAGARFWTVAAGLAVGQAILSTPTGTSNLPLRADSFALIVAGVSFTAVLVLVLRARGQPRAPTRTTPG